ncbi:MAG: hypothetical protein AAF970_02945 [Bacteroidota bacterium]
MPLYLRLIPDQALAEPADQRQAIESAFAASPFALTKPPEPHPRGGFSVWIEAPASASPPAGFSEALIRFLETSGLRSVV